MDILAFWNKMVSMDKKHPWPPVMVLNVRFQPGSSLLKPGCPISWAAAHINSVYLKRQRLPSWTWRICICHVWLLWTTVPLYHTDHTTPLCIGDCHHPFLGSVNNMWTGCSSKIHWSKCSPYDSFVSPMFHSKAPYDPMIYSFFLTMLYFVIIIYEGEAGFVEGIYTTQLLSKKIRYWIWGAL